MATGHTTEFLEEGRARSGMGSSVEHLAFGGRFLDDGTAVECHLHWMASPRRISPTTTTTKSHSSISADVPPDIGHRKDWLSMPDSPAPSPEELRRRWDTTQSCTVLRQTLSVHRRRQCHSSERSRQLCWNGYRTGSTPWPMAHGWNQLGQNVASST